MASTKGPSISDLLQDSLNFMADEHDDASTSRGGGGGGAGGGGGGGGQATASSLLLNVYKDKLAAKGDVLKLHEPEKKPVSAYLNQLGDSIDQNGVEWRGMFGKAKAKSDNAQQVWLI